MMASPILAMLATAAKPAAARAARTLSRAGRATLSDVRFTRAGKIARGSRKLYNDLMNSKYGKPIGRHGMTWAQLADKGYGGGAPAYVDEGDEGGDE